MKIQTFVVQAIIAVLSIALLTSVVGCGRTDQVSAQPMSPEAIEGVGVESPEKAATQTQVPPTSTVRATMSPTSTPEPSATPTATVTPSPTPRPGLPIQLRIPAIGVNAYVEHVGLTEDLAMDVPSKVQNVAWYELGYRPGENGSAVIAGHLDTVTGAPAVFWSLESLKPGDEILVLDLNGAERRFIVDYHTRYPYDDAPIQEIFGPAQDSQLALITCNGDWDRVNRNYSHRVVLYATAADDAGTSNESKGLTP